MKRTSAFLAVTVAALAMLFMTVSSQAQSPIYSPNILATSTITNGPESATNLNLVIDCRKQASVTIQSKITCDAANATGYGINVSWSVDGLTYATGDRTILMTTGGTTATTCVTNLNTFGCGYIRINFGTNTTTVGVTNIVLKYATKISSP